MIDHVAFQMSAPDSTTERVPYESVMIPLKDGRKVEAHWVHATPTRSSSCTIILFNGIGGSLSDWVHAQKRLHQHNISSIAFNYGDAAEIGKSKGKSRLRDVEGVANNMIKAVEARNGPGAKYFLLGHSLGSAVVLQAYHDLDTDGCAGVILCNPFSSLKAWAIDHHQLPKALSFTMPTYYDNVQNVKKIPKPVLIVSSRADTVNLPDQALEIYGAAREPKLIKMFDQLKHNDIYDNSDEYWQPILDFIKQTLAE
jgi:alpha-beta hydrolase superfamily lysophospholipase